MTAVLRTRPKRKTLEEPKFFRFCSSQYEETSWSEGLRALLVLRGSSVESEAVYRLGPATERVASFLLEPKVVLPLRTTRLEYWRKIFLLRRLLETGLYADGQAVGELARALMRNALNHQKTLRPPPNANTRRLEILLGPQVRVFLSTEDAEGLACGLRP